MQVAVLSESAHSEVLSEESNINTIRSQLLEINASILK